MNLKEAKEHLEKIGYKVQRLNESCYSFRCGSSGCGSPVPVRDYSEPSRAERSSNRSTTDAHGGLKNISSLLGNATQTPKANADATIQDLLDKIPPGKKELVIQLLKVLLAE